MLNALRIELAPGRGTRQLSRQRPTGGAHAEKNLLGRNPTDNELAAFAKIRARRAHPAAKTHRRQSRPAHPGRETPQRFCTKNRFQGYEQNEGAASSWGDPFERMVQIEKNDLLWKALLRLDERTQLVTWLIDFCGVPQSYGIGLLMKVNESRISQILDRRTKRPQASSRGSPLRRPPF